jgi:hypothetical protein
VSTENQQPDAVAVFWAGLDAAWRDSGRMTAEDISIRLQQKRNYSLAAPTIRGWLNHTRLPRKDDDFAEMCLLLVGPDRARELGASLKAARRARTVGAGTKPPSGGGTGRTPIFQRLRRVPWPWHAATVIAIVVGIVLVIALLPDDETPSSSPPTTSSESSTEQQAGAENAPPCPTPAVRAESRKRPGKEPRASATYCPDRQEFLLSDDRADDKSAILVVRVNDIEADPSFNSEGHATRGNDGQVTPLPPKPVKQRQRLDADDVAEFRVCVGDRNEEYTYPEDTCGDWTPFWPHR